MIKRLQMLGSHRGTVREGTDNIPQCCLHWWSTFIGPQASGCLETLSSWIVSEKAGQGEECSNLDMLENNSWPHSEHTYTPEGKKSVKSAWLKKHRLTSCFSFTTHLVQSGFYILLHQRRSNMTFHPFQICSSPTTTGEFSAVLNVFVGPAGLSWEKPACPDHVSTLPLLCKIFSLLPLDGSTNSTEQKCQCNWQYKTLLFHTWKQHQSQRDYKNKTGYRDNILDVWSH